MRMSNGAPGNRNCTETFKIRPIAAELKRRGASQDQRAELAMGISLDEYQRMRTESGFGHYTLMYPLIERRMDRAACSTQVKLHLLPVSPARRMAAAPQRPAGTIRPSGAVGTGHDRAPDDARQGCDLPDQRGQTT
jgi:hypothetical protein